MKTKKKKISEKLEKAVKEFVKVRDKRTCQHCKREKLEGANCHASHVIPVSRDGRLKYDPLNIKVLCYHCHINWWHKHPIEAGKWFTDTFPKRWKYLEEQYRLNQKKGSIGIVWLEEQLKKYD